MLSILLIRARQPWKTSEKSFDWAFLRDHLNRCFIINYGDLGVSEASKEKEKKVFPSCFTTRHSPPFGTSECGKARREKNNFLAQSNINSNIKLMGRGEGNAGLALKESCSVIPCRVFQFSPVNVYCGALLSGIGLLERCLRKSLSSSDAGDEEFLRFWGRRKCDTLNCEKFKLVKWLLEVNLHVQSITPAAERVFWKH